MKIETILVIADQQDKQQKALTHAKSMAGKYAAKLHIVAFCYERLGALQHYNTTGVKSSNISDTPQTAIKDKILLAKQNWLNEQITQQDLDDNATSEVVWEKDIAAWVAAHCKENAYDLIIKTGHRSEGVFYVPTDWHLMRNNLVPVLLVREKKWRKKQSILVALDMATQVKSKQALNQKLLDAGITMSNSTGMPLHLCFSIALSPVLKDLGLVNKKTTMSEARTRMLPVIHKMLGEHNLANENIHIKTGVADKVIPSIAADVGAAIVIIGSVGRKGVKAKLMGNTAESVLALLKTDVLVIQP